MKKLILSILTVTLFTNCFAQQADYQQPSALGFNFFLNDFQTAAEIKKKACQV